MKNITLFLLIAFGYHTIGFTQDTEKVKGDRNVTIKQTYVDAFNTVIIGEDFEVELYIIVNLQLKLKLMITYINTSRLKW